MHTTVLDCDEANDMSGFARIAHFSKIWSREIATTFTARVHYQPKEGGTVTLIYFANPVFSSGHDLLLLQLFRLLSDSGRTGAQSLQSYGPASQQNGANSDIRPRLVASLAISMRIYRPVGQPR